MTKVESYDQEYSNINHAYNQIWDSLQVLIEADDSDPEVCSAVNGALLVLDQALDRMKAQKTPKGTSPVLSVSGNENEKSSDKNDNQAEENKEKTKKKHGFVLKFPGS